MTNHEQFQLVKLAAPQQGYFGMSNQQYMPVGGRRKLTEEEQANVAKGKNQWFPKIFQSYGTPAHKMMASPVKNGLLAALLPALGGGVLGAVSQSNQGGARQALGGLAGAALFGAPTALMMGLKRKAENEGIEDIMTRSPENATKRDILSDAVVQKDEDRKQERKQQRMQQLMISQALAAGSR